MSAIDDAYQVMSDEPYVQAGYLAAYRWMPPRMAFTRLLPTTVITISHCLTDLLGDVDDWFPTLDAATVACRTASTQKSPQVPSPYVLEVGFPAWATPALVTTYYSGPCCHTVASRLARPSPVGTSGVRRGYEIVGFEFGGFHSWLCNSLQLDAAEQLGIRTNNWGLLSSDADANKVAAMANADEGAEPVDWFPALIIEHSNPTRPTLQSGLPW